jgi:hypothetical protein
LVYLFTMPGGHVQRVGCVVIGRTPKRVKVRLYDARTGMVTVRTVSPDSLSEPTDRELATQPNGIVARSGHIGLEEWLERPRREWRELERATDGD